MAGKNRNTNSPKDAFLKRITIKIIPDVDEFINLQAAISNRSYAGQVVQYLNERVNSELYKEALDRNMPGWRANEKADVEEMIKKISDEKKIKEFNKKLEEMKKKKPKKTHDKKEFPDILGGVSLKEKENERKGADQVDKLKKQKERKSDPE